MVRLAAPRPGARLAVRLERSAHRRFSVALFPIVAFAFLISCSCPTPRGLSVTGNCARLPLGFKAGYRQVTVAFHAVLFFCSALVPAHT